MTSSAETPKERLPRMVTALPTEDHRRKFVEFIDEFQKMVRPTPWSQRSRMYRPLPQRPAPVRRPKTPEEDHLDFAERLKRVIEWDKYPFRPKVNTDFWARKDTAIQSMYYQPKKDMRPKFRDIFAKCKPYIPLVLPDDAQEPECNATCDTWDREVNPPFLSRLKKVKTLIGHHKFAQLFSVHSRELLGKDSQGSKVFQCKRIRPGPRQVSLDARRRFPFKEKDYHHEIPIQYAVKIVDKLDSRSDRFRLYTEVICLTMLLHQHPNILHCHEVLESEKEIYMVMELYNCPGGPRTLLDFFPQAENPSAQWVFQQLVDAVSYMHDKGVVHNCLKPENVMFLDDYEFQPDVTISTCKWRTDYFSTIRIIDFSKSAYDPQLSTGYNPDFLPNDYFSPEEFALCRADPQVDIRALGRILLAMLVGHVPRLNKDYPYRARQEHPEYEYRGKFDPRMVDLYERIFLAIQGEPDYPPTLKAVRNHPWVAQMYDFRDQKLQDQNPLSTDYMNCETYLQQFCFPSCKHHHINETPNLVNTSNNRLINPLSSPSLGRGFTRKNLA